MGVIGAFIKVAVWPYGLGVFIITIGLIANEMHGQIEIKMCVYLELPNTHSVTVTKSSMY